VIVIHPPPAWDFFRSAVSPRHAAEYLTAKDLSGGTGKEYKSTVTQSS